MNYKRFVIDICSPPDRDKLVATVSTDNVQWAEINQETDRLSLELYPRTDGKPWTFDFDDAIEALKLAKTRLIG